MKKETKTVHNCLFILISIVNRCVCSNHLRWQNVISLLMPNLYPSIFFQVLFTFPIFEMVQEYQMGKKSVRIKQTQQINKTSIRNHCSLFVFINRRTNQKDIENKKATAKHLWFSCENVVKALHEWKEAKNGIEKR